jgi:hypothetical protein
LEILVDAPFKENLLVSSSTYLFILIQWLCLTYSK